MTADVASEPKPVSGTALFIGFAKIGLLGFGGLAAIARHVIVEDRRWLNERDYAALIGLGQVLPGANTVNAAVMLGQRLAGPAGAAAALLGLMAPPLVAVIALAGLYDRFGSIAAVQHGVAGAAASAAGLVIGTGLKMAWRLKPDLIAGAVGLAALLAAGFYRLPLPFVILLLGPASIALRWFRRA